MERPGTRIVRSQRIRTSKSSSSLYQIRFVHSSFELSVLPSLQAEASRCCKTSAPNILFPTPSSLPQLWAVACIALFGRGSCIGICSKRMTRPTTPFSHITKKAPTTKRSSGLPLPGRGDRCATRESCLKSRHPRSAWSRIHCPMRKHGCTRSVPPSQKKRSLHACKPKSSTTCSFGG